MCYVFGKFRSQNENSECNLWIKDSPAGSNFTFSRFLIQHPNLPEASAPKTGLVTPTPLAFLLRPWSAQEPEAKFGWIPKVAKGRVGTGLGHMDRSLVDLWVLLGHCGVQPPWGQTGVQIMGEQRSFIWGWQRTASASGETTEMETDGL